MATKKNLVSIGMPVYNGEKFLRQALDSLLAQDYENFEIIISDNASTDGTADICREYAARDRRIQFHQNDRNLGPVANFIKVFELAGGLYFMWAGDHDLWHSSFISSCVEVLEKDPEVVLAYPQTLLIDKNGNTIESMNDRIDTRGLNAVERFKIIIWELGFCNMFYGIFRAEILKKLNFYRRVVIGGDNVVLAEVSLYGSIAQIPDPLFYRRDNLPGETPEQARQRRIEIQHNAGYDYETIIPFTLLAYSHLEIIDESNLIIPEKEYLSQETKKCFFSTFQSQMHQEKDSFLAAMQNISIDQLPDNEKDRLFRLIKAIKTFSPDTQFPDNSNQEVTRGIDNKSAEKLPFISIVIPTYNRARYVKEAITSALAQRYENMEILIVDDGSTDNTQAVVSEFASDKIKYLLKDHSGAPATRNYGVREAKGDFILWLDSDDVLLPDTVTSYISLLKQFPDVDVFYGNLLITDEDLKETGKVQYEDWFGRNAELLAKLLMVNSIPNPGTMVRRECFQRVGMFDESFKRAHDYEWWSRLAPAANFKNAQTLVVKWRWHNSNMSSGSVDIDWSYDARIIHLMLERYPLQDLFPQIDFSQLEPQIAAGLAYMQVVQRLLQLNDTEGALKYLKMSHELYPSGQTHALIQELSNLSPSPSESVAPEASRFYCPLCDKGYPEFLTFGVNQRPNACCPGCGSLERHRLLWTTLVALQEKGLINPGGRLLHVAPEPCLAARFKQEYDYLSVDLDGKKAMMAMDLTAMTFADDTFDAVVCNHVLEHIPDDEKAIKELYRVLKPGGWASLLVPINGDITLEDLSITDPKERLRLYGDEDHVRYYGRDFADRLQKAGFEALLIPKSDLLEHDELERISVDCESYMVVCRKLALNQPKLAGSGEILSQNKQVKHQGIGTDMVQAHHLTANSTNKKYPSELTYWLNRYQTEKNSFGNAHYRRLMLAMAGEGNENFLAGKIVADFGCGPRGSLNWAKPALLRIGIDVLADKYADCFKESIISHEMVYLKSSEKVIPLPSNFVDIMFTLNAMDHVDHFNDMCKEILRVLKPGGEFIGSFNLGEPPTPCEPQQLSEEIIQAHLLNFLQIISYRLSNRGPGDNVYAPFFQDALTYDKGHQGFLWVRAKKPHNIANTVEVCSQDGKVRHNEVNSNILQAYDNPAKSFKQTSRTSGTQEPPLVSVIVPTYNRPDMLVAALQSVLNQTYTNHEIIVVNDCGLDVADIVGWLNQQGNITYVRHDRNRGLAAARNTGLKLARGKYIAYLDDDDLFYPNHLKTLVTFLETAEYPVAYTDAHRAHQEKQYGRYVTIERDVPYSNEFDPDRLMVFNQFPVLCLMHEKSCLEKVGLFDENLTSHEDWDLWIRLSLHYPFAHIKKVTCEFTWRQDGSTMTSQKFADYFRTMEIIHGRYQDHLTDKPQVQEHQRRYLQSLGESLKEPCSAAGPETSGPEKLLHQATIALEQEDWPSAEGHLRDLIQCYPDMLESYLSLSDVLTLQGKLQEAAEILQAARQMNLEDLPLLKRLGLNCRQRGDLSGAMAAFTKAWNQNPRDPEILGHLGVTCLDLGLFQEAQGYFQEAVQINPRDMENWLGLARAAQQLEDQETFDRACQQAAALNPRHPRLRELTQGRVPGHGGAPPPPAAAVKEEPAAPPVRVLSSIIIPVFNNLSLTRQCLESIEENTDAPHEIIVVDNGSSDGTREYLQGLEAAGWVRVITNRNNEGFARASNQGAQAARGDYLVFLNNDTIVQPGWLPELVACARKDDKIGTVGAKLLYPDDSVQHAGVVFSDKKLVHHIYKYFNRDHPAVNKEREFQAVTAACMLIKKDLFFKIGAFPECYQNGLEDVDLCFTLREQGYKNIYNPRAVVYHLESKTPGRFDRDGENSRIFRSKWYDKIICDDQKYYAEDGITIEIVDRQGNVYTILAHDTNDNPFWGEAVRYMQEGVLNQAEASYLRAIKFNPFDPRRVDMARELEELYEAQGKHSQIEALHQLVPDLTKPQCVRGATGEVQESVSAV